MMVNNFHQYQQNSNYLLPVKPLNTKHTQKTMTQVIGNTSPDLGQAQKCGRVKPVNVNPHPLDKWISNYIIQT